MATVYPSYGTIPSTPSVSSVCSIPPSSSLPVHDHILPQGWQCMKDPRTNRYYFINDNSSSEWDFYRGGQGSCTSSRSSSPAHTTYTSISRYFQPYSSRYKANDATVQRIKTMFPEVDESYINQLLRKYGNRENRVIDVLFHESINPKPQPSQPFQVYQPFKPVQTVQHDEALFYKLRTYFPNVNSDSIKQSLIKFENDEHKVIKSILATLAPQIQQQMDSTLGTPRMKLRYIKLLYPEVDETVLFDLLYNCDLNAQHTIDRLDKMGYKRKNIHQIIAERKTVPASKLVRPKTVPIKVQATAPPKMSEKLEVFDRLQKDFPKADRVLINMALECSQFNEDRARILLDSMTPQDSVKYTDTSWTVPQPEHEFLSTKGTQTNALIEAIFGSPINVRKKANLSHVTHDMGTCTREDGIIVEEKKKPLAQLANPSNRRGPTILNIIKSVISWKGSDPKNRKGPEKGLWKGHNSGYVIGPTVEAKGPNGENRVGPRLWLKKKSLAEER